MSNFHTSQILLLDQAKALLEPETQPDLVKQAIFDYLERERYDIPKENVTFFNEAYANFPIEEVRLLQTTAQYSSSFSGQGQRAFVLLNFETATAPAQNAALKIIEESPKETLIILPVYEQGRILPTIISRCIVVTSTQTLATPELSFTWPENYSQAIELAQTYKDRNQALVLISSLLQTENSSKHSAKKIFLEAYQALRRNQNVLLSLENCFFSLVSLKN